MRRRGARGKPTPPPDQEGRVMENDGTDSPGVSRREFLERVAAGGAGIAVAGGLARPGAPAWAAKGSVTLADVGVGDPGGDWPRFSGPRGGDVNRVARGTAPSGVPTAPL